MSELKLLQQTSAVLWCFIWTAQGQSQQDRSSASARSWGHGCWYGYTAFTGVAKQEKHVEFAWHHFVMAAFLGKLVKRWLIQASPEPMPCAEWAPDNVCGLEKHFHSSVLTSGDQMQWIRRDKFFLCFRLPCLSDIPKSSLKGYCKSDGIFAKIQMSAQQFHPPECLLLLQGSFTPA